MITKATVAKLFITVFFKSGEQLTKGEKKLKDRFGKIDFVSPSFRLDEPGEILLMQRPELGYSFRIYSFLRLISREELVQLQKKALKLMDAGLTAKAETKDNFSKFFSVFTGYMTLSNVYSARYEENFGRVYLFNGIYAQPEYVYDNGRYRQLEFASPEFESAEVADYFAQIRQIYKKQLIQRYGEV